MALYNPATIVSSESFSTASSPFTIPSSITSNTILSANSNRKGATIWNDSTANLFIEFGPTATMSAFTAKINAGGYYEIPFQYTGAISGIWSAVNGNALIRELT